MNKGNNHASSDLALPQPAANRHRWPCSGPTTNGQGTVQCGTGGLVPTAVGSSSWERSDLHELDRHEAVADSARRVHDGTDARAVRESARSRQEGRP